MSSADDVRYMVRLLMAVDFAIDEWHRQRHGCIRMGKVPTSAIINMDDAMGRLRAAMDAREAYENE